MISTIDFILLFFLVLGAILGFRKGFFLELVQTGSFLLGLVVGIRFWKFGAEYVSERFASLPSLVHLLGFLIVFLAVVLVVRLLGKVIKIGLDKTVLGGVDSILGMILGILKWVVGVGSFLWVLHKYPIFDFDKIINSSKICSFVAEFIPKVLLHLS